MMHPLAMRWLLVFGVLLLAACTETLVEKRTTEPPPPPPKLFYPPLPNSPRIQFLASFSRAADVAAPTSGFGRFILGDEAEDTQGVQKPYGVAIYGGKIYVADTRGQGYAIFDVANRRYDQVIGSGPSGMPKPINITIDADGTKYVTDTQKNQVLEFDADDHFVKAYGEKEQFEPGDVAIDGDRLYVADMLHHEVEVLDKTSGERLFTIGKVGSQEGELYFPTNLAVGPGGALYVSDTGNFRVQKFTADGKFVKSFGKVGTGLGSFARPKGVAVDREGRIYVVDSAFENVQVLNGEGRLLLFFGEPASNHPAGLNLPTDVTLDYDNVPYFEQYADPNFRLEYIILVASQFGRNKVNVFGFGRMQGMDYSEKE